MLIWEKKIIKKINDAAALFLPVHLFCCPTGTPDGAFSV